MFDSGRGSDPEPTGGAYSAPPDPLAGFYGPTSKGRGGERRRMEKGGRGRVTMGHQKGNFLVTWLLMFSFIDNKIEAVGAYTK